MTPTLRTGGLHTFLSDRDLALLVLLLTFQATAGWIHPTIVEVGEALGVDQPATRERLRRLESLHWQGEPILTCIARHSTLGSGLDYWKVSSRILAIVDIVTSTSEKPPLTLPASRRDEIISLSRERYSRPKAEVERLIAEQLGHAPESFADTPEGAIRRRLYAFGVPSEEIEELVAGYPLEAIGQQLDWLSLRSARNPARFVVAAVRNSYDPPPGAIQPEVSQPGSVPSSAPTSSEAPLEVVLPDDELATDHGSHADRAAQDQPAQHLSTEDIPVDDFPSVDLVALYQEPTRAEPEAEAA